METIIKVLKDFRRDNIEIINIKLKYKDDKIKKYTITFIDLKEEVIKEVVATYYIFKEMIK